MTPVVEYIKNVGKSFVYTTVEQLGMEMPATKEFMESNEELFKDTYHSIMNIRRTKNRFINAIKKTTIYDAVEYGFDNIVDSFKTGRFNDPYRQAKADAEMYDFGDFESGDSDMSMSNFGSDSTSTGGSMDENTKAVLDSGAANAKSISTATLESAKYVAGVSKANTALLFNQTLKMNQTLSAGFSGLNAGMDALNKFNTEVVQTLAQNATTYFQKTTDILREHNAMFKEFLEMQRNLYKRENEETKGHDLEDVLGVNGMPNIKAYKNMILKNIKNEVGEYIGVDLESLLDGPMLKSMLANPLSAIPGIMMSVAMGPMLKVSLKKMDDTVSGLFTKFLAKMSFDANNDDAPWYKQLFGKIFGANYLDKSSIKTENTKNGPTPFDFQTKRAITEVIPGYLARIEAGITGSPAKLYDDKTGKWTDIKKVKERFDSQQEYNKLQGSSELNYEMNRNMRDSNLDEKTIKTMNKAMEKVAKQRYSDNGHLQTFDGDISKFADYYGLNEKVAKLFVELYNSTSKETRAKTAGDIIQAKLQNIKTLRQEEKLGSQSLYRQLFTDAFDDTPITRAKIYGKDENGNVKIIDNTDENIGGVFNLNNMSDRYGATVFDYLRSIDINTANIGGGKGKKKRGKGTWKDKQNAPIINAEEEENYNTLDISEDQIDEIADRIAEAGKANRELDLQRKLEYNEINITDRLAELLNDLDELVHINAPMDYKGTFGTKYITENKTLQDFIEKAKVPGNKLSELINKASDKLNDGSDIPTYSDGASKVTKSGLTFLSKGEIVIPNASEEQRQLDAINEEKIRQKFINQAKDAQMFAEGGQAIKEEDNKQPKRSFIKDAKGWVGNLNAKFDDDTKNVDDVYNRVKDILFGDSDKETKATVKKVEDEIKDKVPNIATGGMLGAIGGTIVGGPLVGAVLGSALGIASKTEAVQTALFGEKILDENGNDTGRRNGGGFSQEAQKTMKKYMPDMKKLGIGGAVLGMFTPFGLLGGALMGSAIGFIKNNEQAQETLFGKNGLIDEETQKKFKKYFPSSAKGGGAALLLGLAGGLGGVPLLGVAALGAGVGLVSSTDEFKDELLGKKGKDGKRHGGVLEEFKKTIINPFKKFGKDMTDGFKKWFKDDIAAPVVSAMAPMGKQMTIMAKSTLNLGKKLVKGITSGKTGIPLIDNIMGSKAGQLVREYGGKAGKNLISGSKWLLSRPSALIGKFGDKLRERQIENGTADYMSADERLEYMAKKNKDYEGKATDELLSSLDTKSLEKHSKAIAELKNGPDEFDKNIEDIRKNLGKDLSKSLNAKKNNKDAKEIMRLINKNDLKGAQEYLESINIPRNKKAELSKIIQRASTSIKENEYKRDNYNETRNTNFEMLSKIYGKKINADNIDELDDLVNKEYRVRTKEEEGEENLGEEDKLAEILTDKSDEQISELQLLNDQISTIVTYMTSAKEGVVYGDQKLDLKEYANSGKEIMDRMEVSAEKQGKDRIKYVHNNLFGKKHKLSKDMVNKIKNDNEQGSFVNELSRFSKTDAFKGGIDPNYFASLDPETRQLYLRLSEKGYIIENIDQIVNFSDDDKAKLIKMADIDYKFESLKDIIKLHEEDIDKMYDIIQAHPEMANLPQKTLINFIKKHGYRFLNDQKFRNMVLANLSDPKKFDPDKIQKEEDNLNKTSINRRRDQQKHLNIKQFSMEDKLKEKFNNTTVGKVYNKFKDLKSKIKEAYNNKESNKTQDYMTASERLDHIAKKNKELNKTQEEKEAESQQPEDVQKHSWGAIIKAVGGAIVSKGETILKAGSKAAKNWAKNKLKEKWENSPAGKVYKKASNLKATVSNAVEANGENNGMEMTKGSDGRSIAANTKENADIKKAEQQKNAMQQDNNETLHQLLAINEQIAANTTPAEEKPGGGILGSLLTLLGSWLLPKLLKGFKWFKDKWDKANKIVTKISEWVGKIPTLIDDGVKFIKEIPTKIKNFFGNIPTLIDDGVKFIKAIPDKIDDAIKFIKDIPTKMLEGLKTLGTRIMKFFEFLPGAPKVIEEAGKVATETGKVIKETGEAGEAANEAGKVIKETGEAGEVAKESTSIFGKIKDFITGGKEVADGAKEVATGAAETGEATKEGTGMLGKIGEFLGFGKSAADAAKGGAEAGDNLLKSAVNMVNNGYNLNYVAQAHGIPAKELEKAVEIAKEGGELAKEGSQVATGMAALSKIPGFETMKGVGGTVMKGLNLYNFVDKTHSLYNFATADSMEDRGKMISDWWNNNPWWQKGLDAWMTYDAAKYGKDLVTKGKNILTSGLELGKTAEVGANLVSDAGKGAEVAAKNGGLLSKIGSKGLDLAKTGINKIGDVATNVKGVWNHLGGTETLKNVGGEIGSKVMDKAGGIAENMKTITAKVTELIDKCISKISSLVSEKFGKAMIKIKDIILKKLANPATGKMILKAGGKTLAKLGLAATGVGAIVTAGWMGVDGALAFYDGFNDAVNLLGLSGNYDPSMDVKMLAGTINALYDASIVCPIIWEPKEFFDLCLTEVGPIVGITRDQLEEECKKADENPPSFMDNALKVVSKVSPAGMIVNGATKVGGWVKDKITESDTYKSATELAGDIGKKVTDVYNGAKKLGGEAEQTITNGVNLAYQFYDGMTKKASQVIDNFTSSISTGVSDAINFIDSEWQGLTQDVGKGVSSVISNLGNIGTNVINSIKNSAVGKSVGRLWNNAKNTYHDAKNWVSNKWNKAKKFGSNVVDSIKNSSLGKRVWGKGKWGTGNKETDAWNIFHSQLDPTNDMGFNASGDTMNQSMADSGCGPVSAANIGSYFGKHIDSKDAASYALKNGYKEKNGGTKDGFFGDFLGKYGIGTKHIAPGNAKDSLRKGKPVILMGKDKSNNPILDATGRSKTPFGTNPHYVVATGLDKHDNMIIQDPESKTPNKKYKASDVMSKSSIAMDASTGMGKYGLGMKRVGMGFINVDDNGNKYSEDDYNENDMQFLLDQGYSKQEAMEAIDAHYDQNDIKYLMDNGYSKKEAMAALDADTKEKIESEEQNSPSSSSSSNSNSNNKPKKGTMALDWLMKHMPGAVITSKFKDTEGRPTPGEHGGIDIASEENTPIPSTTDGEVVDATDGNPGYGNYVQVKDKAGNFHMYGHMNTRKVDKGDKVKTGDVLGLEGSTGQSTGPHVHYEIDPPSNANAVKSGEHLNPATYDIGNMGNPTSGVNSTKGKSKNKKKYKGLFGAFDAIMDTLHAILFGEDDDGSEDGKDAGSYSGKFKGTGENAKDVFKYLINNGYTETAAAAITGTWNEESAVKSKRIEGDFLLGDNFDYSILKNNDALDDYTKKLWAKTPGGVNEDAYYGTDGHLYPGLGLAQWTGPRGQKLYEFAKDKWYELGPQIEFFNNEMSGSYNKVKQDINNTNNIEQATKRFVSGFEGYEGEKVQARIDSAKAMFEQFGNGKLKNEKDDGNKENTNEENNENTTNEEVERVDDEYYTPQFNSYITADVEKKLSKFRNNDVQYLLDQGYSKREALDALEEEAKEKENNKSESGGYGKWGLGLAKIKAKYDKRKPKFGKGKWGTGNGAAIWEYLKGKGLGSSAIAGIMGNMQAESSLEPTIVQGGGHADEITVDGETGYGLCQWTSEGRQRGLKDFAAARGTKSGDLNTQLDFMLKEVDEGYGDLLQKMDSMSPFDAALLFHKEFERSADTAEMAKRRGEYANQIAQSEGKGETFNGSYSGSSGSSSSSSGSNNIKGLFGAFTAIADVFQKIIGGDKSSGSSGSKGGTVAGGHSSDAGIQTASKWANSMTGQQGFGNNGCTEFVKQYLQKAGNPLGQYMADGSQGNLMWVPTLEEWAKSHNMFKAASEGGAEGDVAICNDHGHVIIADGDGGYWGNSSSRNKIVHSTSISDDFNTPDGYISTGSGGKSTVSNGKATRSSAEMMADGGTSNGWGGSKWGRGGILDFIINAQNSWESLKKSGEQIASLWNPHLREKLKSQTTTSSTSILSNIESAKPKAPIEFREITDEDINNVGTASEAIALLRAGSIPLDKIPDTDMPKDTDSADTIRSKLRKIIATIKPERAADVDENGLVDGIYEKNDVDYLLNNGYTKEKALEMLSKDSKYIEKKYDKNDIDYLMNNGYTKEAALDLLSKDPKYANKNKTNLEKKMDKKSFDLDSVKKRFQDRVKQLFHPDKENNNKNTNVSNTKSTTTSNNKTTTTTSNNTSTNNTTGAQATPAAAQIDYTEKFDTMISLLSTLVQVFTNGATTANATGTGVTDTTPNTSAINMVNSRNIGAVRSDELAKLFTNINNSMNALASR